MKSLVDVAVYRSLELNLKWINGCAAKSKIMLWIGKSVICTRKYGWCS